MRGRKKERGEGKGRKKTFLFSLPVPSPLPLTLPISSSLREVSTWRFREQIARSKKTPALQANSPIERFQMTSRPPYCNWCPKTIKQQPVGVPNQSCCSWRILFLWKKFLNFVSINLFGCWPPEWKSIRAEYRALGFNRCLQTEFFFILLTTVKFNMPPQKQSGPNSKGTPYRQSYTMMRKLALPNIILSNESV